MAYIIAVVAQKGGTGKSTLTRLLARELAANDMTVAIADLDTHQQTCRRWGERRAAASITPAVETHVCSSVRDALAHAKHYDAVILDDQGHASQQTVDAAAAADVVIIPSGQTTDDLEPTVELAEALSRRGTVRKRIAVALVKTTRSEPEIAAARHYIREAGCRVLEGELPTSTAYGQAHDAGKAATETAFGSLNAKADAIAQGVIDLLAEVQP